VQISGCRGVSGQVSVSEQITKPGQVVEAILARLDPIERAIMATPARTIAGLGVKRVTPRMSRPNTGASRSTTRLTGKHGLIGFLIEAVCNVAHAPLLFNDPNGPNSGRA
jgi:hypothetical protein